MLIGSEVFRVFFDKIITLYMYIYKFIIICILYTVCVQTAVYKNVCFSLDEQYFTSLLLIIIDLYAGNRIIVIYTIINV